jgi:hypothetical protein
MSYNHKIILYYNQLLFFTFLVVNGQWRKTVSLFWWKMDTAISKRDIIKNNLFLFFLTILNNLLLFNYIIFYYYYYLNRNRKWISETQQYNTTEINPRKKKLLDLKMVVNKSKKRGELTLREAAAFNSNSRLQGCKKCHCITQSKSNICA